MCPLTMEAIDIVMTARYPYLKWWQQEGPDDKVIVEKAMKRREGVSPAIDLYKTLVVVSSTVFLAKALAQQTEVLLLDEPT